MISNAQWFLLIGLLMLAMGMMSSKLRQLPFTSSIIYLLLGLVLGPTCLNLFQIEPYKESALLELLTEAAVLVSLFSVGVKMPYPLRLAQWRLPILLASLGMVVTVSLVAAFAYYVLTLPLGACVLLGAIVAPTDPVLATDVQIREPGDRDSLRFNLTCEGGMNDGTAFPFVMLGLGLMGLEHGSSGLQWVWLDLVWATLGAIAIGWAGGKSLAWLISSLRNRNAECEFRHEFLSLGLIGVVYGMAVMAHTWGFLAVFFASVALHQAEVTRRNHISQHTAMDPSIDTTKSCDKALSSQQTGSEQPVLSDQQAYTVSEDALMFKEYLEGLSEIVIILLVGGMMLREYWNWQTVSFAAFLFLVARPISVLIVMLGSDASWRRRTLVAWFGIRGIGSLYYLVYAIQHGLPEGIASKLIPLVLVMITLSILLHGTSVKPLLGLLWRRRKYLD